MKSIVYSHFKLVLLAAIALIATTLLLACDGSPPAPEATEEQATAAPQPTTALRSDEPAPTVAPDSTEPAPATAGARRGRDHSRRAHGTPHDRPGDRGGTDRRPSADRRARPAGNTDRHSKLPLTSEGGSGPQVYFHQRGSPARLRREDRRRTLLLGIQRQWQSDPTIRLVPRVDHGGKYPVLRVDIQWNSRLLGPA